MKRSPQRNKDRGAMPGATALLDRLNHVRKRKRVFDGQTVDMEAIRRQISRDGEKRRGR